MEQLKDLISHVGFHDFLTCDFQTSDPTDKFPVSVPGPKELHETPEKNMICSFDKVWPQRLLEVRNSVFPSMHSS